MPYDEPDPKDPMALSGVLLQGSAESAVEAACAFADQLAASGMSETEILQVFQSPGYRGPHTACLTIGLERTAVIIRETITVHQACRAAARLRIETQES